MDRVSYIEDFAKDEDVFEKGSFLNAFVRCLSSEEAIALLWRSIDGNTSLRGPALRRVCSAVGSGDAPLGALFDELQEKIETGAPRRRATYAYCLLELARAGARHEQDEIQAFLSSSKYVGLRRRGYKLFSPESARSRELLSEAWLMFRDWEAAWLIVKTYPAVELVREKPFLVAQLTEGWQLSKLYLKLAELDAAHVEELLEIDPISYVYVRTKLGRPVHADLLSRIFNESLGDDRLGLFLWCLGESKQWHQLVEASHRTTEIAKSRYPGLYGCGT